MRRSFARRKGYVASNDSGVILERGPDTVRTVIGHDHVITFLENLYTPSERTLLDAGETDAVVQSRLAFQRAMEARFVDCVEQATGRKVRAKVTLDKELIGGIRVVIGDKVIDGSARAQLGALENALKA